jgi:hypothetical protein
MRTNLRAALLAAPASALDNGPAKTPPTSAPLPSMHIFGIALG